MSVFSDAIKNFLYPIQGLLDDPDITEILINGPREIFVEKKGKLHQVNEKFQDESNLISALRAIAQSVGKTFDQDNPKLDAFLPDGSRLAAIISPIAVQGTTVAIRKFSQVNLVLKDLISSGSLSSDAARFLDICVYLGKNVLVSGGTGSGKTTLLNVLGGRIPNNERVIIIEDAQELQIQTEHLVRFMTRKEDKQKSIKEMSTRDLVHGAMRLRPDRIVVGEVRGDEALDLVQVMNTGHDGSMGTIHANNPFDACIRLESLCLLGESPIPPDLVRKMIASALEIIVQTSRMSDGSRKVTHIAEVLGTDASGQYICRDIFKWMQKSRDSNGRLIGEVVACNVLPSFFNEIKLNKLPLRAESFKAPTWVLELFGNKSAA